MPDNDTDAFAHDAGPSGPGVGSPRSLPSDAGANQVHSVDPLINPLIISALLLVAVLLATGVVALILTANANDAPRTSVERDIVANELAVTQTPADTNVWANLAYAYAEAGRYDDAFETIARARRATKERAFSVVEADVLRISGRYDEAIVEYDKAERSVRLLEEEADRARLKVGVAMSSSDDTMMRIYFGRGLCEEKVGDTKAAISDFKLAHQEAPEDASVAATLGDLYQQSGDRRAAESAYRDALKYIPDDKQSLAGLKRLGVSP